jgi:hypothetical protein
MCAEQNSVKRGYVYEAAQYETWLYVRSSTVSNVVVCAKQHCMERGCMCEAAQHRTWLYVRSSTA